jgi:hypothetical protein
MSAELVDPFAAHEPDITPEEWMDIRDEIYNGHWDDRSLYPELLVETLRVLGEIGTSNTPNPAQAATQSLRRMVYRVKNGCWRHETEAEPAWSLDSERRLPR